MAKEKKFAICRNKGFHITFENGWIVSIQWGCCNYCDNYGSNDFDGERKGHGAQSDTAEVWCWNEEGVHYPEEPTNRSTPEEVLEILNEIKSRKRLQK